MQASISLRSVAEVSRWFHVLVEAEGRPITLPEGRRVAGFNVWRKVRAADGLEAGHLAKQRVLQEWSCLGLGDAPRLHVGAVAPLGRLTSWAVRDGAPQWLPA